MSPVSFSRSKAARFGCAPAFAPLARPVWDALALPEERAAAWLARGG
jgi:hypothetical protein